MYPSIFILGSAKHGKDSFAELICNYCTELTFQSSSKAALKFIYPTLKEKYLYTSEDECYEDRDNARMDWERLIFEFNTPEKTKLAKLVFSESNIYVGLRNKQEYLSCLKQKVSDLTLWVDASKRVNYTDPSLSIEYDARYMVWVDNNGKLPDLEYRAQFWAKSIRRMLEIREWLDLAKNEKCG
ncbi:MAG: hypothetical protein KME47_10145 [Nodosilinea sp. WJT8-NPBG4]|jgi:hypothetical protein|nr:hypothetical protein [Nodosilinea sp. WJT8-NPBG4]